MPDEIKLKSFEAGHQFMTQDKINQYIYVINKGIVKCFLTEENGRDYIVAFLGEGEIIGELELIRKIPNICSVTALVETEVFQIGKTYFAQCLENEKYLNQIFLNDLASRLEQTVRRASYQQIYPVEYTMLKLLLLSRNQAIDISKKDLADYLAIPVRSLNRAIQQLRSKKIIPEDQLLGINISETEVKKILQQFEEKI